MFDRQHVAAQVAALTKTREFFAKEGNWFGGRLMCEPLTFWRFTFRFLFNPKAWGKTRDAKCLYVELLRQSGDNPVVALSAAQAMGFLSLKAVFAWNDAPERTHAEILARIDDALEKLGAVEGVMESA